MTVSAVASLVRTKRRRGAVKPMRTAPSLPPSSHHNKTLRYVRVRRNLCFHHCADDEVRAKPTRHRPSARRYAAKQSPVCPILTQKRPIVLSNDNPFFFSSSQNYCQKPSRTHTQVAPFLAGSGLEPAPAALLQRGQDLHEAPWR